MPKAIFYLLKGDYSTMLRLLLILADDTHIMFGPFTVVGFRVAADSYTIAWNPGIWVIWLLGCLRRAC